MTLRLDHEIKSEREISLKFTVLYDTELQEVTELLYIWVVDRDRCIVTDIAPVMIREFNADHYITTIDWRAIAAEQIHETYVG